MGLAEYVERAGRKFVPVLPIAAPLILSHSLLLSPAMLLRSALRRGGSAAFCRRGYSTGNGASALSRDEGDASFLSALVDRYHDGRPLSPAEKHLVRSELLRAPRPPPSLKDHISRLEGRLGRRDDDSQETAAATSSLLTRPDQDEARRKDLTELYTVTIDDASTVELDDGLSAELAGDGKVRVFVHIADVTRYLRPEDPLATAAGERVRTLYLPHTKKPMLPMALGAEACSLREGVDTPSLTVTAVVRLEDGSLVEGSSDVMTTVTRSSARLTYDAVDAMIGDDDRITPPVLELLMSAATARRRWREPRAALAAYAGDSTSDTSTAMETALTVCGDNVIIDRISRHSPSRDLVTELMILAGEVFAEIGLKHTIALPYRSQTSVPVVQEDMADMANLATAARRYQLRKHLLKSSLITSPSRPPTTYHHHALGLAAYVQGTSPIRRFVDLLAHWEIKAHLRGETGSTPEQLDAAVTTLEKNNRRLTTAERAIDHAYLCAYVTNKGPGHIFPSCTLLGWLNQDRGIGVLFVPELGRELVATINRPAVPGDTNLPCTATAADPFTGTLSLTCN